MGTIALCLALIAALDTVETDIALGFTDITALLIFLKVVQWLTGADSIDDADVLRAGASEALLGHRAMAPSTLSGQVPTATLREAAIADVGSLREEGDRAFLIYRGAPEDSVYAISMSREGDAWKVASLSGMALG